MKSTLALIDHEPGFVNRLLLSLSSRMYGIVQDIETYSLKTPLQRVVGFLVERSCGGYSHP